MEFLSVHRLIYVCILGLFTQSNHRAAPANLAQSDLSQLQTTAKEHPADAKAQARYGSALAEAGKRAEGIHFLRRAVKLDNKLTAAWHNLAIAAEQQTWMDIAADAHAHVLAARPGLAGEWIKLGYVLLPMGRFDEAERAFKRAAALQPNSSEALVAMASTEFAFFHYDSAISNLKRALAINPRSAAARADLASIELDQGRRENAETACRAAISIDPNAPRHRLLLAQILIDSPKAEKRAEAIAALAAAEQLGKNSSYSPLSASDTARLEYLKGLAASRDQNWKAALEHWKKSYTLDAAQPVVQLALARALIRQGGVEAREGSKILMAYQRSQKLRDRARQLGMQAETHPHNFRARLEYGKLLLAQNSLVHAEWELHEAVLLSPRSAAARKLFAQALKRQGRNSEAD